MAAPERRGFRAPDDSDLKPFETETVSSITAIAAEESSASTTIDTAIFKARPKFKDQTRLPVYSYKDDILYLLEQKSILILSGETGSGKSTLVPPLLLKSYHKILIIEPRRLAAITLSKRVSKTFQSNNEFSKSNQNIVGHGVRFDHSFNNESRIVFVTDGVFLNMLMSDPLLTQWDIVIVDECHERTISLDICLGLLKKIINKRNLADSLIGSESAQSSSTGLKLIAMSATFNIKSFIDFFGFDKCKCLSVQGREHAVSNFYLSAAVPCYLKAAMQTIVEICSQRPSIPGDILVFLTSSIEIEQVSKDLKEQEFDKKFDLYITQLYSTLPSNQQLKSIEPMMSRKLRRVVLSTNIAETSLTIPGIQFVIDCGFVRRRYFSPQKNIEAIVTVPVSATEALQRTGRAGRERPGGRCYRLWRERAENLVSFKPTEVERLDLSGALMTLSSLGVSNYVTFPWLSPGPNPKVLAQSVESLFAMKLIDEIGNLTKERGLTCSTILTRIGGPGSGRRGLQHAVLLLEGAKNNIGDECCKIVAMLSVKQIYILPRNNRFTAIRKHKSFMCFEGDLISLLNIFDAYSKVEPRTNFQRGKFCREHFLNELGLQQAMMIYSRLKATLKSLKLSTSKDDDVDIEVLQEVIASSYFLNSAYLNPDGYYYTFREKTKLKLHQDCCLFGLNPAPKVVTFGDTTEASYQEAVDTQQRVYKTEVTERLFLMKEVTAFEGMEVLYKMASHYFTF